MKKWHQYAEIAFTMISILALFRFFQSFANTQPRLLEEVDNKQDDIPPLKIGAKRLAIQFSTLLPQVNLTLISVLQGMALGVLIGQFKTVSPLSFPEILFYIDSVLVIAIIWHLYANAFLTFIWPFSGKHTLLQFALATVESFAFNSIANPALWVLGLSGTALIGALIRWVNTKILSSANYEREDVYILDVKTERIAAKQLFATGLILSVVGGIHLIADWQQSQYLNQLNITVALGAAVICILLLLMADNPMPIQNIFRDSSWLFENYQVIERETNHSQNLADREANVSN